MRRLARLLAAALILVGGAAHIGSPDAWFEGQAGPYPVRVTIRSPGVVPGKAEVLVRVNAPGITGVELTNRIWNAADGGMPPWEAATRVPGADAQFTHEILFMAPSSYLVLVRVTGPQGTGTANVPFSLQPTRTTAMTKDLGIPLALLGALLVAGLITLAVTGARESTLAPGAVPDARRRRRGRIAGAVATAVAGAMLLGGWTWWQAEQRDYVERRLFRPVQLEAMLAAPASGARTLRLHLPDSMWTRRGWTPFVPEHGKMMHLFLVSDGTLEQFAHLHPVAADSSTWDVSLPALPAGRYRLYGDVVHESGFPRTMVATVELPSAHAAWTPSDADDNAAHLPTRDATADGPRALAGDRTIAWQRPATLRAGDDGVLRFSVRDAAGRPAEVEPYLGMAGHAVVMRKDGGVFVHLHPHGTAAMASMQALTLRTAADTARGAVARKIREAGEGHAHHGGRLPGEFAFPFAFPSAGTYRVWVQAKVDGAVRTASWEVTVGA